MRLFHAPASPYARKVRACAVALGLDGRIELVVVDPNASPPELLAANPLSKVPCLLAEDGVALFDSPVICEYLDGLPGGEALALFPPAGGARWLALRQQALGDGTMDAALVRRTEGTRPEEAARNANVARQKAAIDRSLDRLEHDLPHRTPDIGSIAIGCALGYLDLRFAADGWRTGRPALTAWFEAFVQLPCMVGTAPA